MNDSEKRMELKEEIKKALRPHNNYFCRKYKDGRVMINLKNQKILDLFIDMSTEEDISTLYDIIKKHGSEQINNLIIHFIGDNLVNYCVKNECLKEKKYHC